MRMTLHRRCRRLSLGLAAALAGVLWPLPAVADHHPPATFGATRLFARVPAPGHPEGIVVHGGMVYVGTHVGVVPNAGGSPSKIFGYDVATGAPSTEFSVTGQNLRAVHGLLALAFGPDGRLYAVDRNPPRLLAFDVSRTPPTQETYATIPTMTTCQSTPCTATASDTPPLPDGLAFDRTGRAYVSDVDNGTIFRIPPGGGRSEIWFQDPRIDGVFGPNGITVDPTGTRLYFVTSSSTSPTAPGGSVYSLPITDHPDGAELRSIHAYSEPGALPDGIAFGRSGALYVTLGGIDQFSVLNAEGTEVRRFPNPVENQQRPVPFDNPANIDFDGNGSILVPNQAFFSPGPAHWAILSVWVDDDAADAR